MAPTVLLIVLEFFFFTWGLFYFALNIFAIFPQNFYVDFDNVFIKYKGAFGKLAIFTLILSTFEFDSYFHFLLSSSNSLSTCLKIILFTVDHNQHKDPRLVKVNQIRDYRQLVTKLGIYIITLLLINMSTFVSMLFILLYHAVYIAIAL